MRPPTEMRPQRRGVTRGRAALVVLAVALFVLVSSLRGLARFYTDYLWFDSLDFASVWLRVLTARIGLVLIFTAIFAVVMWVNLFVADRLAPRDELVTEPVVERYRELVGGRAVLVRTGVSLAFGLIAGLSVGSQWENWLLLLNRVEFGRSDPQFGVDVGFYVFQLPFLSFLVGWAFTAILIIFLVTALAHYLNGGIRLQTGVGGRVTAQVKAHLSLLLGLLALVKAAGYWFDRYELTLSTRGFSDGASYTDVNAQLPALQLLLAVSLFSFLLLVVNIWRRGFTWPIIAVGLWALVAVGVGSVYPAFVQRFRVEPSESTREAPFIERNIEATLVALGLDQVEENPFNYEPTLSTEEIADNRETVDNVRILDPGVLEDTFTRLQGVRSFYTFPDIDVDRYEIDGKTTQVVLSARELDVGGVPTQSWVNRHVAFTHGYGLAIAPANRAPGGQPQFVVGGVPIDDDSDITIAQPRLYFGEDLDAFAIVGADRPEVDFQSADQTRNNRYDGDGGVGMGSLLRRAAFALRFGDINPLISSEITGDSRILFNRDVVERVGSVAPFLDLDADPYPVVVQGRVLMVLDGYTTTDRYPYAQRADVSGLSAGSGLQHRFNYVRNSIKVTVDAYDGTVTLYIIDPDDPLAQAYRKIFPDLFSDEPPPVELVEHFRYPEDIFRVQTNMWGRYRIEDPVSFYEAAGAWNVAQDPGDTIGTPILENEVDAQGVVVGQTERRIDPQYLLLQLPGDDEELGFVLFRPFVPFSEDDVRKNLTGFMVAHSDPDRYGEIEIFDLAAPDIEGVSGPAQFDAEAQAEDVIATEITLLNREGSEVRPGNLLLIPVEQSLIYVRPLYLIAQGSTPFPQLERVIVGVGDNIAIADTFEEALAEAIGQPGAVVDPDPDPEPPDGDAGEPPTVGEPPDDADVATLVAAAADAFADAEEALADGDLGAYQDALDRAEGLVARAALASQPAPTATTEPEPTDA